MDVGIHFRQSKAAYAVTTMSLRYDINMATFGQHARDLLADIDRATTVLRQSKDVPDEVRRLVRTFDEGFGARDPETRLAGVDPYLAESLLGGAIVCLTALTSENAAKARREMRLGLEQVRQALRDIIDEAPFSERRPARDVVRWLAENVGLSHADLAMLVGVSPRSLQRWLAEGGSVPAAGQADRIRVVAEAANHLRHSFTPVGIVRWFERQHPRLDDRPPARLLEDPTYYPTLVRLAARARSSVAT
jgi:hypothetical protein